MTTPQVLHTNATIGGTPCFATCKTCRHWKVYDWQPPTARPQCDLLAVGGIFCEIKVTGGAVKCTDSHPVTSPDFGCIHHEPATTKGGA